MFFILTPENEKNVLLYINFACLSICLFVSNRRQKGWTDRALFFWWDLTWTQESFMNDQNRISRIFRIMEDSSSIFLRNRATGGDI